MTFTLYPAIDLRSGRCVRLFQGDFQQETVYDHDPVTVASRWEKKGAKWLHIVDLDAARTGDPVNISVIRKIVQTVGIPVQVGGGVRDMKRLKMLLDEGVTRVVIGSAAVDNPDFVKAVLNRYADRIAVGLDARNGLVATHGWLDTSKVRAEELGKEMAALGADTFIFTDISRDGTLMGPNTSAVRSLAKATGKNVIASGGVKHTDHLRELARFHNEGVAGAIVGKALYTGDMDIMEALRVSEEK